MKKYFLLLFILFVCGNQLSAQTKLKRKYYGTYEGQINEYPLDVNKKLIQVKSVPIRIEINAGYLNIQVGKLNTRGTYKVLFEADDYYVLDAVMENQNIGERIVVFKRGGKISRDGLFPQPSARLFKN
ncbi:MAG: hypothetical protein ACSHXL_03085 [Bacteroidota bacterium]